MPTIEPEEIVSLGLQQFDEEPPPALFLFGHKYVLDPFDVFVSDELPLRVEAV